MGNFGVVLLIVFLLIVVCYIFSWCTENFRNVKALPRSDVADTLLYEIERRINVLILHLKEKYEPTPTTAMTKKYEFARPRMLKFIERYSHGSLRENWPSGTTNTSYTQLKGQVIAICLRSKNGLPSFHEINDIIFVVLHELAHVASFNYGHGDEFWATFRIILEHAVDMGIYTPIDYKNSPREYCGINITYNPLYDNLYNNPQIWELLVPKKQIESV